MTQESYDEHRQRDKNTIENFMWIAYFFPSVRWLIPLFIIFTIFIWGINILGESTILNSKDIYYSGINPWTGKMETIKGCRPQHLTQEHQCNNQITLDTVKKAFPFLGNAK